MREAVRTSVLSTRWISLWKSAVRVLDFDGWNLLQLPVINSSSSETGIVAERRLMYINWVNGVIKTPAGLSNIKCLRSLRLSFVNVREEIFEYILSHCPLLEELAVERSSSVYNLKVTGSPSSPLALKYLEVSRCFCLTSLEIDHAPSLTRLSYGDGWVDLHVKNCSSLAHLSLAFADDYLPGFAFEYLSDYAGQLESLSLEIHPVSR
ncbi:hypothetical protein LINPERPRIM_LOCUS5971 [Linum perenne]